MQAWNVILNGRLLDVVFWNTKADGGATITANEVRKSLIEHDGYDSGIIVRKAKS